MPRCKPQGPITMSVMEPIDTNLRRGGLRNGEQKGLHIIHPKLAEPVGS